MTAPLRSPVSSLNSFNRPSSLFGDICTRCQTGFQNDEVHMAIENTRWHADCFKCSQCFSPLMDEVYYFFEGRLYCKHDFEVLYSPVCALCCECHPFSPRLCPHLAQFIVGIVKKALNKSYHSHCFRCSDCDSSLEDGVWNDSGKIICKDCKKQIPKERQYICSQCKQAIAQDDLLRRGHEFFHACHFDCTDCKINLTRTARELKGHLYCPRCYDIKCEVCAGCRKVIDPQEERSIFVLDKHYHVEHFVCFDCGKPFLGHEHFEKNKKAFCKTCFVKRYGDYCFDCQKGLTGTSVRLFGKGWCASCYRCWLCSVKLSHSDKVLEYDLKPVCKRCLKNKQFLKTLQKD